MSSPITPVIDTRCLVVSSFIGRNVLAGDILAFLLCLFVLTNFHKFKSFADKGKKLQCMERLLCPRPFARSLAEFQ